MGFSTEEKNERQNYQPITIEEKLIPDWFYLPYCDVVNTYRELTNNVCSCQTTHKISLSCVIYENEYIWFLMRVLKITPHNKVFVM